MTDDCVDSTAHVVTTIDLGDGMVITVRRPATPAAVAASRQAPDDGSGGAQLADRVAVLEGTVADLPPALAASVGMSPARAAELPVVTPAGIEVPASLVPAAAADSSSDPGQADQVDPLVVQTPPQPVDADDPLVTPAPQANSNVAAPFDLTGIGTPPPLAPDAPGQG